MYFFILPMLLWIWKLLAYFFKKKKQNVILTETTICDMKALAKASIWIPYTKCGMGFHIGNVLVRK